MARHPGGTALQHHERRLMEEHTPQPDAYKVDQAARQLGLSAREVRRRIDAGELASVRVGRAVRIPRAAIETFLTSRNRSHR
jgi:excisionase family DNA binding protein